MDQPIRCIVADTDREFTLELVPGASLLEGIIEHPEIPIDSPCGGSGICGKCRVRIISGDLHAPDHDERRIISSRELEAGIRLACRCVPKAGPLRVETIRKAAESQIYSRIEPRSYASPRFHAEVLELDEPSLTDQRSLLQRVSACAEMSREFFRPSSIRALPKASDGGNLRCLFDNGQAVRPLGKDEEPFGCAVDIGTTTVAAYLVNLLTGEVAAHRAELNAQGRYGADVISRIRRASESGVSALQKPVVQQIDRMAADLCTDLQVPLETLHEICFAGNTAMMHLLLGCDPSGIAAAPYIPVFTRPLSVELSQLGFTRCAHVSGKLLGAVSSYIGSDITAGVYASEITSSQEPAMLIDIGTNGEIVLWDGSTLYCCSSAAGPALEGATILHGTGGIAGAVCSVTGNKQEGRLSWKTIGSRPPRGICGSGIIDAMALLLDFALVDETGAMVSPEEDSSGLIIATDHGPALAVVDDPEHPVSVTDRDVREIQLAKAAIAAGIATLLAESGLQPRKISRIVLAGGFGNYIHIPSALRIGLLPGEFSGRIETGGNTSGKGAAESLLDRSAAQELERIRSGAVYIELSGSKTFQQRYIEEMLFPAAEEQGAAVGEK